MDLKTINSNPSDYLQLPSALLASMAFQVELIREFEQALLKLSDDGCIHGPVHTGIGQEACAAGVMAALHPNDKVSGTHRAHHVYLSKIISHYLPKGLTDFNRLSNDIEREISSLMGEVMGLSIGCCSGRGGSMHLFNEKIGMIGSNAIVAGGVPLAAGAAFASRYRKTNEITVCFLGDGGVNQGAFHEALNLAGLWKLPFICFIENNQYAVATSVSDSTATKDLAVKAAAYGMEGVVVDGMDALAVQKAVSTAADLARRGGGPTLIEAKCYRYPHHAGASPGSSFGYRDKAEEEMWKAKDPCRILPEKLIEQNILTVDQVQEIQTLAKMTVDRAIQTCTDQEKGKYIRKESLWPKLESIAMGSRSDGSEFSNTIFNEAEDFSDRESTTYVGAIAAVTGRHLEKNPDVFVLGEEVANFGGGAYGATKDLPQRFSQRVLNTPISENGFTGLAGGAAMMGLRPIVELMFSDFGLVAADQLFNQIGKLRFMYGNAVKMPVVVRTRVAIGCGYGGQHSSDPVGLYSLFSGWRIVTPANAFDYIGLFNSAMRSEDPVLICEHHSLYPDKGEIPKGNLDYFIEFGKAKLIRPGNDVTVLCYSSTVSQVSQAAEDLQTRGISVEVIDLRTVSLPDIDYRTIGESLKKTGVLVVVEQAHTSGSIGSRITHECQKRFFDYLDGPMATVTGLDFPLPVSKRLESAMVPHIEEITRTIHKAATRQL